MVDSIRRLILIPLFFLPCCGSKILLEEASVQLEIEIDTGAYDRVDTILSTPLPSTPGRVQLFEKTEFGMVPTPCQIDPKLPRRLFWVLRGFTPRKTVRKFIVVSATEVQEETPAKMGVDEDSAHNLVLRHGLSRVLRYNAAVVSPLTPDIPPIQARGAHSP